MKKTKIICTIGPSSMKKNIIKKMCKSGMNAARINMSHGDFAQYKKIINMVRSVCDVPIILDTQGPEVRSINQKISFNKNEIIRIGLSVNVFNKLKKGIKVLLNDGLYKGVISEVGKDFIKIRMNSKGELIPNRSIIFKNTNLKLPILTEKDKQGIKFAVDNKIEFIALSYTRNKEDLIFTKKVLGKHRTRIIAKIENKEGIKNIKDIIKNSYALMVARGDLGVEIPSEKVPLIQKDIIKKCNTYGSPVIVATQMMESMINNKTPTRAETSDVANAIMDGADCVMLSGETSIGLHPELVVKTMNKICLNTEKYWNPILFEPEEKAIENIITYHAFKIAQEINSRIICLTRSGYTARMINRFRPKNQVIAITPKDYVARRLMISYGVYPIYYKNLKEYDNSEVTGITNFCLKKKLIKRKDIITFVAGLFVKKTTNTITTYKVEELLK